MDAKEFDALAVKVAHQDCHFDETEWAPTFARAFLKEFTERSEVVAEVVPHPFDGLPKVAGAISNLKIGTKLFLHPPAPEREWQPIETAPKDGTDILIFTSYESFYVASYDDVFRAPWRIRNDEGLNEHVPTHWMPLPAEPNKERT